jgi:hypothetical protein
MTIIYKSHIDNSIPIEVGYKYQFTPGISDANWIEIVEKGPKYVRARGLYNNHADLSIPIWKFDDLVYCYIPLE